MATQAKTTSSSTVSTSDQSMSTVFSSCRILDVAADIEDGVSGNGVPSIFQYPSMSMEVARSDMRYYFGASQKGHRNVNHHIRHTCYLCKGNILKNHDIYMYRGELPFCSLECRIEQIEMDVALERLHQTQLKNHKGNSVPADQNKCWIESDSCIQNGVGNLGYNVVRFLISLVVS